MKLRPRAAAIILNENREILLLRQRDPNTKKEWWTLPGGGMEPEESAIDTIVREVEEECCAKCRPHQLIYVSEYIDETIGTHHIGMFFLATLERGEVVKTGYDPEVDIQYIQECRFVSREELLDSKIPIYPQLFKHQFWMDLEKNFCDYEVYHRGQIRDE